MSASYLDVVESLRQTFPQPVSDRLHDSYVVFSFMRVLDQVDQLKSARPMLGQPESLDLDSARSMRMEQAPRSVEQVNAELVDHLSGMFIWGHPHSQVNVLTTPTITSIIGGLLPSIYNPNICSEETSRRVALAEVESIAMTADLVGYDPDQSGGVFTFGGTGTLLYGAKIGLEKSAPGTSQRGIQHPGYLLCSGQAHYACMTVANWLGLGQDRVIQIPTNQDNAIKTDELASRVHQILGDGESIAAVVATMGTTDAFGVDDLETMRDICDTATREFQLQAPIHLHADAVIGWAWSVFRDYDFTENRLEFRPRTVRALAAVNHRMQHLQQADSIGVDFHKTGFTPYVSSAILTRCATDLHRIIRDDSEMPYLFQSGTHHPGKFTLETSRSGSGPMAAFANLRLFGKDGLRSLLGHLVSMAEVLREELDGHASATVLNRDNYGPVTLFRVYPDGVDTFVTPDRERTDPDFQSDMQRYNEYNRRVFELIHDDALQGEGCVLSLTDNYRQTAYGQPMVALKSYIMSPFTTDSHVHCVLESIGKARQALDAEFRVR